MSGWASGLYEGQVVHERTRPRHHRLSYRIFQVLIDLDEVSALGRAHKLLAYNRAGLISFHDRDHGPGDGRPLRPWVEAQLAAAGIDLDGGAIRLLCMPRVLGQVFNPLSVYFCHRRTGELAAIIHEVTNTFGQRHSYVLPAQVQCGGAVRQSCDKRFFVSPFMEMDLRYDFVIRLPAQGLFLGITTCDAGGPVMRAFFTARRAEMSDRTLARAVLGHPLLAAKVLGGIHLEALKLLAKGLRLRPCPRPLEESVTVMKVPKASRAA
jgi:DUF1365 family protein